MKRVNLLNMRPCFQTRILCLQPTMRGFESHIIRLCEHEYLQIVIRGLFHSHDRFISAVAWKSGILAQCRFNVVSPLCQRCRNTS